jgi:hypothetical protein
MDNRTVVMGALRRASLHARLMQNELDTAGVALKGNAIDAETAVDWAYGIGCHWLLDYLPEPVAEKLRGKAA